MLHAVIGLMLHTLQSAFYGVLCIVGDSDDAYQLAMHQLGSTDIDIVASTVGLQNLCLVHLLKAGVREEGLTKIFEALNGESSYNRGRAERLVAKYMSYSNK